jgi:hypothetical protein
MVPEDIIYHGSTHKMHVAFTSWKLLMQKGSMRGQAVGTI